MFFDTKSIASKSHHWSNDAKSDQSLIGTCAVELLENRFWRYYSDFKGVEHVSVLKQ